MALLAHRTVAIVAIGDELILGQSLDTNSRWLSERLLDAGVRTLWHETAPDNVDAIAAVFHRGLAEADLVVSTGGLGPTADDLTREAAARALDVELVEDAGALATLESWAASRGVRLPATNRVQAQRPASAVLIPNDRGTAPGFHAAAGDADLWCLPGPPRELRPMVEGPLLASLHTPPDAAVATRLVQCFGIGESAAAERLGGLLARDRNPIVGITASLGQLTLRLRAVGFADPAEATRALDDSEAEARQALGPLIYGVGDTTIAREIVERLAERGERLVVAESCTGGRLGGVVTDVAGSSAVFSGGWVTYTNAMKHQELGVPRDLFPEVGGGAAPGAVSREVAEAMARGALGRGRHGFDDAGSTPTHALAVTGIAGPGGGSDAKPVGTVWICRASADGSLDTRRFRFRSEREAVRAWSVQAACWMLWLKIGCDEAAASIRLLGEQR